jgi:hypothetical protein
MVMLFMMIGWRFTFLSSRIGIKDYSIFYIIIGYKLLVKEVIVEESHSLLANLFYNNRRIGFVDSYRCSI